MFQLHMITKCQFAICFPSELPAEVNAYTSWSLSLSFFYIIVACLRNHVLAERHATCPVIPPFPDKAVSNNKRGGQTLKHETEGRKTTVNIKL